MFGHRSLQESIRIASDGFHYIAQTPEGVARQRNGLTPSITAVLAMETFIKVSDDYAEVFRSPLKPGKFYKEESTSISAHET